MKNFLKYLLVIALCVITVSSQTMPVAAYAADEIESDDWDDEECDHIWEKATCTEPATCEICDETKGKKLGSTVRPKENSE